MKINSTLYDWLKWICLIAIPALTTLTSVVLSVWHICSAETITAITTTATAVSTCIGALIGISTIGYNKSKEV